MNAVGFWFLYTLRRRWLSLVVIALLVAIAGSVVLSAVAGARRGVTSADRLKEQTLAATVAVVPNVPGVDWREVEKLPYVESLHRISLGAPPVVKGVPMNNVFFYPGDDALFSTIEKAAVLDGRLPDPNAANEVVITNQMVKKQNRHVGDKVEIRLPGPGQAADWMIAPDQFSGPVADATIVGVVRGFFWTGYWDGPGGEGVMILGPGIFDKYADLIAGPEVDGWHPDALFNAMVRLENPEKDRARLKTDLAEIMGRPDVDMIDGYAVGQQVNKTLEFEASFLIAFAIAALIAGGFLIGQALSRLVSSLLSDLSPGAALGMTPRQLVAASAGGPLVACAVGSIGALALSVVASRWFPIGSASFNEPDPGIDLDPTVLIVGAVGLAVLSLLATAGPALWALRAARRQQRHSASPVATVAAQLDAPVPVQIGTRYALESGRGSTRIPSRPALLGSVAGVAGVAAAITFAFGVSHTVKHPELMGQTFMAGSSVGDAGMEYAPGLADLTMGIIDATTAADQATLTRVGVATHTKTDVPVELWSFKPVKNRIPLVITEGREPEAPNEVSLSPGILADFGAEVGDTIRLAGNTGTKPFKVVGKGFVPGGPHTDYNHGGWITDEGYDTIFDTFKYEMALVASTTISEKKLVAALNEGVPPEMAEQGMSFMEMSEGGSVEMTVEQLRQVRQLPVFLACFLGLVAVAAVGHVLVTSVRRRRHELAVFRAIGTTPMQSRGIVFVQAGVVSLIGVGVGLPLGVALGRTLWREVADITPFQYVAPAALLAAVLVGIAALFLAQLLAAVPARRAARLGVASILRAE